MNTLSARDRALQWALDLVREHNWVAFDTETTGLAGQVIEWAVVAPDGIVLGQGYVKPTCPIEDGARLLHGITESQLADAPDFIEAWGLIYQLLRDKTVVIYNAVFDIARLVTSAHAHKKNLPQLDLLNTRCAMEHYAAYHGERHWRGLGYKWQSLSAAMAQLGLRWPGNAHSAAGDAQACAAIVRELARRAQAIENAMVEADKAKAMSEQRAGIEMFDIEKGPVQL